MFHLTTKDIGKNVLLSDNQSAKIVSVIVEQGQVVLVVLKSESGKTILWDPTEFNNSQSQTS